MAFILVVAPRKAPAIRAHWLDVAIVLVTIPFDKDPVFVAEQMGHSDPGFSMKFYSQAVKRWQRLEGAEREQFQLALQWAQWADEKAEAGTNGAQALPALPWSETEKTEAR